MTIQRTEFQIAVTGAPEATVQFAALAKAEAETGAAAAAASAQVDRLSAATAMAATQAAKAAQASTGYYDAMGMWVSSAKRAHGAADAFKGDLGGLASASSKAAREAAGHTDAMGRWVPAVKAATAETQRFAAASASASQGVQANEGALKRFGGVLDKVLGPIRLAAYILPGLGIAGIIGGIASAVGSLYDAAKGALGIDSDVVKGPSIADQALRGYNETLERAVKLTHELAAAQVEAGRSMIAGAGGVSDEYGTGGEQFAQFGVQRTALRNRRAELDARAAQLAADKRALDERRAAVEAMPPAIGIYSIRADMMARAEELGARTRELKNDELRLHDEAVELQRQVRRVAGAADDAARTRGAARGEQKAGPNALDELLDPEVRSLGPAERRRLNERIRLDREAREQARAASMRGKSELWTDERDVQRGTTIRGVFSMLTSSTEDREAWRAEMREASAGLREVQEIAISAASGAKSMGMEFGAGLGQAAAAAILTGKSFVDMANKMAQSLAIRAAGEAIWELAQAAGNYALFLFTGSTNAAAAASAHLESAGLYASIAAGAIAGTAATGGFSAGGGSRGRHGSGGGGTELDNPYASTRGASTNLTVVIGGEVVSRQVIRETARQERTGGIGVSRLARAS